MTMKFRTRYRIVRDQFSGFEVQMKRWWWPWWTEIETNTHCSVPAAETWLNRRLALPKTGEVVKYIKSTEIP